MCKRSAVDKGSAISPPDEREGKKKGTTQVWGEVDVDGRIAKRGALFPVIVCTWT